MSVQLIIAGIIFLAVIMLIMSSGKYKGAVITAEELKSQIAEKTKMTLLDVRTPAEFTYGHITNAVNLPLQSLETSVTGVVPDKASYVVTYCASGRRSAEASKLLVKMGYTNLRNYSGSMNDWMRRGNQITK